MKSKLLAVLAVFVFLTTGTARAGVVSLWDGTGANDSTSWSALGSDGTSISSPFTVTSAGGVAITGSFAGGLGLVAIACPATPSCSWGGFPPNPPTFPAGDTLVWTLDNNANVGTGPLTLGFGHPVLAGGAAIQPDSQGSFNATVEAFNGSNPLGSFSVMSDSNGDPVFIGLQDTAAEITSLVFNITLTGCTMNCTNNDFAMDTLISENLTAAVPLPAALPLFATGLGGLGLLGWRRKRKAQTALGRA